MSTKTKAPRIYGGANYAMTPIEAMLPWETVAAMDDMKQNLPKGFLRPKKRKPFKIEPPTLRDVIANVVTERSMCSLRKWVLKRRLQEEFGQYPPKEANKIIADIIEPSINKTLADVLDEELAGEDFDTPDDTQSACTNIITKTKEMIGWKTNMERLRHAEKIGSERTTMKKRGKWQDAVMYELPPIVKGLTHEPSRYTIKLPDGRYIDLGLAQVDLQAMQPDEVEKTQIEVRKVWKMETIKSKLSPTEWMKTKPVVYDYWMNPFHLIRGHCVRIVHNRFMYFCGTVYDPVLKDTPNKALWAMAKRLGIKAEGGDHKILNTILGTTDVPPNYKSIRFNGEWLTQVGWQRDAKNTPSKYILENGEMIELAQERECEEFWKEHPELDERNDKKLNVSEMEYAILSDVSDVPVEDEEGDIVDYMNPEQEGLYENEATVKDFRTVVDTNEFNQDEMDLFQFMRANFDVEQFVNGSFGDLEMQQLEFAIQDKIAAWNHRIETITTRAELQDRPPTPEESKDLAIARERIEWYERIDEARENMIHLIYTPTEGLEPTFFGMAPHGKYDPYLPPLRIIPGASKCPDNNLVFPPPNPELKQKPKTSIVLHKNLIHHTSPTRSVNFVAIDRPLTWKIERARNERLKTLVQSPYGIRQTIKAQVAFNNAFESAISDAIPDHGKKGFACK